MKVYPGYFLSGFLRFAEPPFLTVNFLRLAEPPSESLTNDWKKFCSCDMFSGQRSQTTVENVQTSIFDRQFSEAPRTSVFHQSFSTINF